MTGPFRNRRCAPIRAHRAIFSLRGERRPRATSCGSWLTRDDFANHRGEEVTPVSSGYRGLDVVELPPNGQGLVALVLLNILENFDLASLDPNGAERLHIALEAARLAFAVRDTHVADPAFMRLAVSALL